MTVDAICEKTFFFFGDEETKQSNTIHSPITWTHLKKAPTTKVIYKSLWVYIPAGREKITSYI